MKKNPKDIDEVLRIKYVGKKQVSHDTYIFTFMLPDDLTLGLNLGNHIAIE